MIADLDPDRVAAVAAEIGCAGQVCDVTDEAQVIDLVESTLAAHGPIDLLWMPLTDITKAR